MNIEYEATFPNIDKINIRQRLKKAGAKLIKPEFLQKRITLNLPQKDMIDGSWLRVRDEEDKITLSLKIVDGHKISNQKELELKVDNFENAVELLKTLGAQQKAYQETKRELWKLNNVDVTIDEWPFLEPFVEIEGLSEEAVIKASKKLGFNYNKALFCSVDTLYSKKYNLDKNIINNQTPKIIFNMPNPFLSNNK